MAILSVTRKSGTSARDSATGERTQDDTWQVITDDYATTATEILQATGLPRIGQAISATDLSLVCVDRQPEQTADAADHWLVTVSYSNKVEFFTAPSNPLDRPPVIAWTHAGEEVEIYQDALGLAIASSAGQIFDPAITHGVNDIVLTITRNQASFDPIQAHQYLKAMNSDVFYGFEPGEAAITIFDGGQEQVENNVRFFSVTTQIQFKPTFPGGQYGWNRPIVDQGTVELDEAGNPQVITDDDGLPLNAPVYLDGTGHQLGPGLNPVFRFTQTKTLLPFAALNLP